MHQFRDGFLPYLGGEVKDVFEDLKRRVDPQVGFTHARLRPPPRSPPRMRADVEHLPQPSDPRVRDPQGGRRRRAPERLLPAQPELVERKLDLLERHFPSQAGKHWFDRETFVGLMRLRGMEAVAPDRFAEAFTARKAVLASGGSTRLGSTARAVDPNDSRVVSRVRISSVYSSA